MTSVVFGSILYGRLDMSESLPFPMTYDQYLRYHVLQAFIDVFYSKEKIKVIDVGGLSPHKTGDSFFLPISRICPGKAYVLDKSFQNLPDYIQGSGLALPFQDESFKVVAALDVLEHIPPNDRSPFLQEICRVSSGSVVISAPYQDQKIEQVEELLFNQIKQQYGVEHQQLLEHKTMGLPKIEDVSEHLSTSLPFGVSFSYGALKNWLLLQSLKNSFLLEKSAEMIHSFLDKWFIERFSASEFESPYARHFWIYSREISQSRLNKGLKRIQDILRHKKQPKTHWEDFVGFHQALVDSFCRHRFSIVVVTDGESKYLSECLQHISTQKVEHDLDIAVWDIGNDNSVEQLIHTRFPGIQYLTSDQTTPLSNALFKVISPLNGDFILMISADILLPSQSVSQFYQHLNPSTQSGLLSPRIDQDGQEAVVWDRPDQKNTWISSECLFFRKDALCERKWENIPLSKEGIFRWERMENSRDIMYFSQMTVYKK